MTLQQLLETQENLYNKIDNLQNIRHQLYSSVYEPIEYGSINNW